MNRLVIALIAAGLTFTFAGCDFQPGGAHPEEDGKAFLKKHGYAQSVIGAVVNQGVLSRQQIIEFSKSQSPDVRFLVASNPNLQPQDIELFLNDRNDYARSGTAYNPNLSPEQIARLFDDPSHTVYCSLARNPAVPTETLLRLHKQRNPGLVWFAMNPKCPEVLKNEILKSGDNLAKQWLAITEGKKHSEPDGAANGSQPIRSETNGTSPAAGSRR
jgi:hypothetical protein